MNNKEYIICPAIKRLTTKECTKHYYNNDIYDIEIGYRHCDIFGRFKDEVSKKPQDQGFYTSKGRFVNRKEALEIAIIAQQVKEEDCRNTKIGLFSEDLY